MVQRVLRWVAVGLVAGLVGCAGPASEDSGDATVVIDGSSTVFPISRAAMEGFKQVVPGVDVVVNKSGTGGGFGRYLENEVDIVDASRPARAAEEAQANAQGIPWARFLVGYDGITLVVNAQNDFVRGLTVDQLRAIWRKDSQVRTWKDIDPSWPDRPITLYGPDKDSGTFEFFVEAILGKGGTQRPDIQASADDNFLVRGVAGDPDGLGYFGYAYFEANKATLHAVAIQPSADGPAVAPSPETILARAYAPLARPLFLYVKKSAARRPAVGAFLRYYVENAATLATKARYVAPTTDETAANRKSLSELAPATLARRKPGPST